MKGKENFLLSAHFHSLCERRKFSLLFFCYRLNDRRKEDFLSFPKVKLQEKLFLFFHFLSKKMLKEKKSSPGHKLSFFLKWKKEFVELTFRNHNRLRINPVKISFIHFLYNHFFRKWKKVINEKEIFWINEKKIERKGRSFSLSFIGATHLSFHRIFFSSICF